MGNRYFFEYGALQERTDAGPRRLIECDTSALPATTISEAFAIKIADALNLSEDGMGNDMLAMREIKTSLEGK